MTELYYVQTLKTELARRISDNAAYSQRAMALSLDIDPSLFNKIISEKQLPTLDTADKICKGLKLNSTDAKEFMQSLSKEKACAELYSVNPSYTNCRS